MSDDSGFIPPHGNYKELLSYQKAGTIYDLTCESCRRFLAKTDRTIDQMIQGARSGKQNIVEGSKISATSKETELKLLGFSRASLQELLEDYRDYLRTKKLPLWDKYSRQAQFVRRVGANPAVTYEAYREFCETRSGEVVANIAICLIHQAGYLLDRQISSLERNFVGDGGIREQMTRARREYRERESGRGKRQPAT
jgi:four helix bundle suffix protein